MKNLLKMRVLLSVLIGFLLTNPVAAAPEPAASSVTVGKVSLEQLGVGVRVTGVVRSRYDIDMAATIDGELTHVLAPGTFVNKGGIVAKVDGRQLQLLVAEQQVLRNRAEVNAQYLGAEVTRLEQLRNKYLASETQLAEMTSRYALAAAEQQVVDVRIRQLEERLSRTQLLAPVTGVIAARYKQSGEFANRGETIVRLVNPAALEVAVAVPVQYATRLQVGERLAVMVNELEQVGVLRAVVYAATQASQTIEVIVDLPSVVPGEVIDGQFAEVKMPLNSQNDVLLVPRDAVVLRSTGSFVFRINEDNLAEKVDVTLGVGRGDRVSVQGELSSGDRVAIRGAERLSDGQAVTPS